MNLISTDQENKINQILESGIDEFKKPSHFKDDRYKYNNKYSVEKIKNKEENVIGMKKNKKTELKSLIEEIKNNSNSNKSDFNTINQNELHYNYRDKRNLKMNDFSDFRHELTDLQSNIDRLEKKLFDNGSYSFNSPLSAYNNTKENIFRQENILNFTKNVLEKSGGNKIENIEQDINNEYIINHRYDRISLSPHNKKLKSSLHNRENSYDNLSNSKFVQQKEIILNLEKRLEQQEMNVDNMKSEIRDIRYEKDEVERELIMEKEKNNEVNHKLQKMKKYSDEIYEVNMKYSDLVKDYDKLSHQYENSEKIRTEQTRLIKSLQREIDLLRENYIIKENRNTIITSDIENEKSVENPFIVQNLTSEKPKKKEIKSRSKTPIKKENSKSSIKNTVKSNLSTISNLGTKNIKKIKK